MSDTEAVVRNPSKKIRCVQPLTPTKLFILTYVIAVSRDTHGTYR